MILRCGVKVWNRWRKANPETLPTLERVCLRNAYLVRADLVDAYLVRADLRGAYLRDAHLSGATLWDADLLGANLRHSNLVRADLEAANLVDANLVDANLETADLKNANLRKANLGNANLGNATLEYANLEYANLVDANLVDANLGNANLGNANLGNANLDGTDFDMASLFSTHFHDVDLREVKGLEEARYLGPSPVSSQTLRKSQGHIPEKFLKGCGLEDWEILASKLHDPNLRPDEVTDIGYQVIDLRASSPIVPLSVFISYTRKDQGFVEKVEGQFDKDGIRSWRDVHDVVAGPLEVQVDRAIGLQRVTLLVLSTDSVKSDWVEWEVTRAREVEQERGGQYVLCPVALDDSWKKCSWPKRIRTQIEKYAILDFSRWGSDSEFEDQYERLKKGLGIYYANQESGE